MASLLYQEIASEDLEMHVGNSAGERISKTYTATEPDKFRGL